MLVMLVALEEPSVTPSTICQRSSIVMAKSSMQPVISIDFTKSNSGPPSWSVVATPDFRSWAMFPHLSLHSISALVLSVLII